MRAKNNRSSERRSLQRAPLPLPSAEQFPRSWGLTFLLQEKLTNTDCVTCPTHVSRAKRDIHLHHEVRWRTRQLHRCNGSAYATVHATAVKNLSGDDTNSGVMTSLCNWSSSTWHAACANLIVRLRSVSVYAYKGLLNVQSKIAVVFRATA